MTLLMLKVFTMGVLGLLAALEWLVSASQVQAINTVANLAALVMLIAGLWIAPKAFKARSMESELKEKDRIIATRLQLAEAAEASAKASAEKAAELGGLLDDVRHEAATWQARYEEQSRYTAGPALEAITTLMERSGTEAERRHKEMLLALRALRRLVPPSAVADDEDEDPVLGPSA